MDEGFGNFGATMVFPQCFESWLQEASGNSPASSYLQLADSSPVGFVVAQFGAIVYANRTAREVLQQPDTVAPFVHPFGGLLEKRFGSAPRASGSARTRFDLTLRLTGNRLVELDIVAAPCEIQGQSAVQAFFTDATPRRRRMRLLEAEKHILGEIAASSSLQDTLSLICRTMEETLPGALTAIMLLDEAGERLYVGAAPSLPVAYRDAISGVRIGLIAPCCGRAAFQRGRVVAHDIEVDANWGSERALVCGFGLRACWSEPIFVEGGRVGGTIDVYYPSPCTPAEEEHALVANMTSLAGVALSRLQAQKALAESERRYRSVVTALAEAVLLYDRQGRILAANPSAARLFGCPGQSLEGTHIQDLYPRLLDAQERPYALGQLPTCRTLQTGAPYQDEIVGVRTDAGMRWFSTNAQPVTRDGETMPHAVVGSFDDITDVRRTQRRLEYLASHDLLTRLPNRAYLQERLARAVARAERDGTRVGVLFIDLDGFKKVNDTLGHDGGDLLLKEVAQRLHARMRAPDIVGRHGGDEFVVLAENIGEPRHLAALAHRLISACAQPFKVFAHDLYLSASVGVAIYPDDGATVDALFRCADSAMYAAKESGRNRFRFYTATLNERAQRRMALEASLRRAFERKELALAYQPKVDIASGVVFGVEALTRWISADLGVLSPAEFIPLAEETGLIQPLGRWVIDEACRQIAEWRSRGLAPVHVAVNVSAMQFKDDQLLAHFAQALDRHDVLPCHLEVEITESVIMADEARAIEVLAQLKRLGVVVSIDDFGTGYSSLSRLRQFTIDALKIDQSFVSRLPDDEDDAAITDAVIALAHKLSLKVVAEGVETEAQREFLRRSGCDLLQGYLISPPLDANGFEAWMAGRHSRAIPLLPCTRACKQPARLCDHPCNG